MSSLADRYRRIWIAPRAEAGFFLFIFRKRPRLDKREDGLYVYDLPTDSFVKIVWCREYRQRKYRAGHGGRT